MHTKQVRFCDQPATLACDGNCGKAWGTNSRPKEKFDPQDSDDFAFLADGELGDAPEDPGTYEGGDAKPSGPHEMNRWCARECERSKKFRPGEEIKLIDFSRRVLNQPWKHPAQKDGKPHRACVLIAKIEADTPKDMADALECLADRIRRGEISSTSISGGYNSGWIVDYQQSDRPTHDEWFQQLQAYLDEKRTQADPEAAG